MKIGFKQRILASVCLVVGALVTTAAFTSEGGGTVKEPSSATVTKSSKLKVTRPVSFQRILGNQYGNTYGIQNLFDGKISTGWAFDNNYPIYECDQLTAFRCNVNAKRINSVKIWNGYCKSDQAYYNNTRPAYILIYRETDFDYPEPYDIIYEGRLADTMSPQTLKVSPRFDNSRPTRSIYVNLGYDPDGFYYGNKYNDLVISEMEFYGIPL